MAAYSSGHMFMNHRGQLRSILVSVVACSNSDVKVSFGTSCTEFFVGQTGLN